MIKLYKVTKIFDEKKVLDNITYDFVRNKTTVIFGPSGSGKTTLLKCLAGLYDITSGSFKKDKFKLLKKGYVFQEFNLWNHLTALENIMLAPLIVQRRPKDIVKKESVNFLTRFGLLKEINRYPHELSGGQKQRVAIIRSLAINPDLIFLDEITSSLDPFLVKNIEELISVLSKNKRTLIIVTHDLDFAKRIGHKFIFLKNGKIIESGDRNLFENPRNFETKQFINSYKRDD